MAFEAQNARLFGLDLGRLWRFFRFGWEVALHWRAFAWLDAHPLVGVVMPDGELRANDGASALDRLPDRHKVRRDPAFRAVVLPQELVLAHTLRLPHMLESEIEGALKLQVQTMSPFPSDVTDWGWRIDSTDEHGYGVTFAFVSRRHVQEHFERLGGMSEDKVEVWADVNGPIVLRGYGERARMNEVRSQRRKLLGLMVVCLLMVLALPAAHFWQLRSQVLDAQQQLETLSTLSTPLVTARNDLVSDLQSGKAIVGYLGAQPDANEILARLTTLIPDNAWLSRLEIDGRRIRIVGQSADAAGLMEILRSHDAFGDLRPMGPIRRGREGLDSFQFEFRFVESGGQL